MSCTSLSVQNTTCVQRWTLGNYLKQLSHCSNKLSCSIPEMPLPLIRLSTICSCSLGPSELDSQDWELVVCRSSTDGVGSCNVKVMGLEGGSECSKGNKSNDFWEDSIGRESLNLHLASISSLDKNLTMLRLATITKDGIDLHMCTSGWSPPNYLWASTWCSRTHAEENINKLP